MRLQNLSGCNKKIGANSVKDMGKMGELKKHSDEIDFALAGRLINKDYQNEISKRIFR